MPTYEYACQSCGRHVEVYQSFSDEPLTRCSVCGGPLRKVFHPAGILFKGSGFYKTDSRSGRKPAVPTGAKADGGKADGSKEPSVASSSGSSESSGSSGSSGSSDSSGSSGSSGSDASGSPGSSGSSGSSGGGAKEKSA